MNWSTRAGRLIGAAAATMLIAAPVSAQQFVMKLTNIAVNEPTHEHMKMIKEEVEKRSGGRIKAEVYPGAQLGGFPRMIEGVQFGTIEVYTGPPGFQRGLDPRMQIVDTPGLYDDMEHGQRVMTDPEFRNRFLEINTPKGLKGISLYNYGPTAYASTTPLRRIEDFRGKKIRVLATRVEIEAMSRLGASGVPMDLAEVLPALQTRVIDAVRSSMVVMGAGKYFSVAKTITDVQDSMIPIGVWVSTVWFNKLPADLQKVILDVGRETEDPIFRISLDFDKRGAQVWRDNGAEVIQLSTEERAEFMRRVRSVADEVLGNDPQLKDMYGLLKNVTERHRRKS
ncbi:MAG: TRAP transporter substrate-binding protein [Alphaproteobacteria bacterium]|nr:TRAP transporter substrate-binding protein [Alphaproteobacteria bacterium]